MKRRRMSNRNRQTRDEKKCKAVLFGSSGITILRSAEDKKGSRDGSFCQDFCWPTQDGANGQAFWVEPKIYGMHVEIERRSRLPLDQCSSFRGGTDYPLRSPLESLLKYFISIELVLSRSPRQSIGRSNDFSWPPLQFGPFNPIQRSVNLSVFRREYPCFFDLEPKRWSVHASKQSISTLFITHNPWVPSWLSPASRQVEEQKNWRDIQRNRILNINPFCQSFHFFRR
jgi:hypothetical protein